MACVVLIIGPHSVGKTTVGEIARGRLSDCSFVDLDSLLAKSEREQAGDLLHAMGPDGFLDLCRKYVDHLAAGKEDGWLLASVGAGALFDEGRALAWLRGKNVICLTATPEVIWERARFRCGYSNMDEMLAREFSGGRQLIYESAASTIDVSEMDQDQAAAEVVRAVERFRKLMGVSNMQIDVRERVVSVDGEEYVVTAARMVDNWHICVKRGEDTLVDTRFGGDPDIPLNPLDVVADAVANGWLGDGIVTDYESSTGMYQIRKLDGTVLASNLPRDGVRETVADDPLVSQFKARLDELDPNNSANIDEIESIRDCIQVLQDIM